MEFRQLPSDEVPASTLRAAAAALDAAKRDLGLPHLQIKFYAAMDRYDFEDERERFDAVSRAWGGRPVRYKRVAADEEWGGFFQETDPNTLWIRLAPAHGMAHIIAHEAKHAAQLRENKLGRPSGPSAPHEQEARDYARKFASQHGTKVLAGAPAWAPPPPDDVPGRWIWTGNSWLHAGSTRG